MLLDEKFKSTINLNANSIQIQNKKPNLNECLSYGSIVNYLDMLSAFSVRLCIQAPKRHISEPSLSQ